MSDHPSPKHYVHMPLAFITLKGGPADGMTVTLTRQSFEYIGYLIRVAHRPDPVIMMPDQHPIEPRYITYQQHESEEWESQDCGCVAATLVLREERDWPPVG